MLSPAPPHHVVPANTSTEISPIQLVEHWPQIEVRSFMTKIKVPLHRQLWIRELPFGLFLLLGHGDPFQNGNVRQ